MQNPDVYLEGTRDAQFLKQEHAYIIYEILKCHEDIREDGDPECASIEETNNWLKSKAL